MQKYLQDRSPGLVVKEVDSRLIGYEFEHQHLMLH